MNVDVQRSRLDIKALELTGVALLCYFIGHPTSRQMDVKGNHSSSSHLKHDSVWGAAELWQQKSATKSDTMQLWVHLTEHRKSHAIGVFKINE